MTDLWETFRYLVQSALNLFGAPDDFAHTHLPPRAIALMRRWLSSLEAYARRLILIAAADIESTPPRPPAPRAAPQGRRAKRATHTASFSFTPPAPSKRSVRKPGLHQTRPISIAALARRLEALARLAADPTRCIRRAARALQAKPAHARDILLTRIPRDHPFAAETAGATSTAWERWMIADSS